jgi:homoserine dehydrogenase
MRADLALVGFGNVGRRVASLLDERRDRLLRDHDLDCRIVGIATLRHAAMFACAGIDVEAAQNAATAGAPLPGSDHPASIITAADVIAALCQRTAALRVLVETTTLRSERSPSISWAAT